MEICAVVILVWGLGLGGKEGVDFWKFVKLINLVELVRFKFSFKR